MGPQLDPLKIFHVLESFKVQSQLGKMSETSFSKQTASLAKTFMFRGFDPEEWARSLSAQSDGDKVHGIEFLEL